VGTSALKGEEGDEISEMIRTKRADTGIKGTIKEGKGTEWDITGNGKNIYCYRQFNKT
jgi:hypothetical protein